MGTLADCSGLPEGQSGTPVKWLVQPAMMMALLPRALEGAGAVATTRPPARRTGLGIADSVRAPVAHAEGQASARAGAAPRRDVDGGSLRGDGGACCDHVTARRVIRSSLPREYPNPLGAAAAADPSIKWEAGGLHPALLKAAEEVGLLAPTRTDIGRGGAGLVEPPLLLAPLPVRRPLVVLRPSGPQVRVGWVLVNLVVLRVRRSF